MYKLIVRLGRAVAQRATFGLQDSSDHADEGERELLITNADFRHLYTWVAGMV